MWWFIIKYGVTFLGGALVMLLVYGNNIEMMTKVCMWIKSMWKKYSPELKEQIDELLKKLKDLEI